MGNLEKKVVKAAKWSTITEIIAKLIVPITNMILARILSPEAFGVVATVTMIISFTDMFTDAGFSKFLIQYEFKNEKERELSTNVAFWTNLAISIVFYALIIIFRENLSRMVGNPGLGNVIAIASFQLILTSFSTIQMAIYKRKFDFKTLFLIRIVGVCLPFLITIPLAILGCSYWALIIGNLCGAFLNSLILTIKSTWKPKFEYSFKALKKMTSFSLWSLVESITIWLTMWVDTFIIGNVLNSYYLGIYKASLSAVNSIFALITSPTTPILFSALSRLQNNEKSFKNTFLKVQRLVSYIVVPASVGIFLYSDVIVKILLGNQWPEANKVVAMWGLTTGFGVILSTYCTEAFRAKGKPKLSFLTQFLHLIVLVPACYIASKYDFNVLVTTRALMRFQLILVILIFLQVFFKIKIRQVFKNISASMIASCMMVIISIILKQFGDGIIWSCASIFICVLGYLGSILLFKSSRNDIKYMVNKFILKNEFEKIAS